MVYMLWAFEFLSQNLKFKAYFYDKYYLCSFYFLNIFFKLMCLAQNNIELWTYLCRHVVNMLDA